MSTIKGTNAAIEVGCKCIAEQDVLRDGEIVCREVYKCMIYIL